MSKLSFVIAACVTLLASSTGMAAFTVTVSPTANANVWDLGSFEMADTTVNKFTSGGNLVTSGGATVPDEWKGDENKSEYTSKLLAGTYQVFLVEGHNNDQGQSSQPFTVAFNGLTVAGVVASNGFRSNGEIFNVWGGLDIASNKTAGNGLLDAISAITGSDFLQDLLGSGARAIDIIKGDQMPGDANNPDSISLHVIELTEENVLTYSVNGRKLNSEYSLVFAQVPGLAVAAVPEPTTFAIWGLCSMGVVVAARRRTQRLAV